MSQSEKSFNVSDRRHFTPEGRPRADAPESDEARESAATATPPSPDPRAAGEADVDFSRFVVGLAGEAGRLLAGEGDAAGAQPAELLAGARQVVGILEMLKDKTKGNLNADEDALLAELLFQLRMAYVERTRVAKP